MTKKAPRAGNVRKLTEAEAQILEPKGGMVDESVPCVAMAVIRDYRGETDPELLAEFFGARLGRYRMDRDATEQRLSVAREVAITAETVEMIAELRRRLERVPDLIQARADEVTWRARGELWFSISRRLDASLADAGAVLSIATTEADGYKGKVGGKSSWARDALVRDLVAKISELSPSGNRKGRIAAFAHDLLSACGVELPNDLEDFKKLARKAGKD